MKVLFNLVDKFLFAVLLIAAMQIPILADHYRQYLSGYYDATQRTIEEYQALANQFGYSNVAQMIAALKQNDVALVREDARNKARTLETFNDLQYGLNVLNQGNYFKQAWYMFDPKRFTTLKRVGENFAPSLPLAPSAVLYSLLLALFINVFIWSPLWCVRGVRRIRQRRREARSQGKTHLHT